MALSKKVVTLGLLAAGCLVLTMPTMMKAVAASVYSHSHKTTTLQDSSTSSTVNAKINQDVSLFKAADPTISEAALTSGLKAYYSARAKGLDQKGIFTLINYTKPSSEKRLWVLDMQNHTILFNELVAHAKNSGDLKAKRFSNQPDSHQTSLGLYITENTYIGHRGLSLRLKGLSPGLNTNAGRRDVVVHGADYVSEDFVKTHGRLGRSWGCPALSMDLYKPTIDTIKEGTLVYAYYSTTGSSDSAEA